MYTNNVVYEKLGHGMTTMFRTAARGCCRSGLRQRQQQQQQLLVKPTSSFARSFASTSTRSNANNEAPSPCTRMPSDLPPVYVSHIPHYVPYGLGLKLQEHLYSLRGEPEVILLLEHTPVYTEGRRGPADGTDGEQQRLTGVGADYFLTGRGGLITYHGPGQLVGYPIMHLGRMQLTNRCYVDRLQNSLISTLSSYTLPTVPPPENHTGVWSSSSSKIVSIGVQVRHRITSHGFALNVTSDVVPWFQKIVACGIQGKSMTNMQEQLALRISEEEVTRPDRGASPRVDSLVAEKEADLQPVQKENTPLQNSDSETTTKLGPEAKMITVQSVVPRVIRSLGDTFKRNLTMADEALLRYEADENNVLTRAWVKGQEITK